jgi:hypothetical protein
MEYDVLRAMRNGSFSSEDEIVRLAEASDARQATVGALQVLIYLVSGIWILRWIYVAASNARALAASPMEFSPGWSVGWYFIPFLNLWKPYQAMKEIWRVSADPRNPDIVPASSLLSSWWLFYIVASLSGNAAFRMSLRAEQVNQLLAANLVTRISDVAGIPLAIIFIFVVRRIRDNQAGARARATVPEPESAVTA